MTASIARQARSIESTRPYAWILSPAIDLIFCCGGLLWLLFALQFCLRHGTTPAAGQEAGALQALVVAGTILFANPHSAATLMRLYGEPETRKQLWVCSYPGAAAAILIGAACILNAQVLGIFARVYLILIIHHVLAQVRGIALIYCYKRNYPLNWQQKRSLSLLLNSIVCLAILRQFTDSVWYQSTFNSVDLPSWQFLPYWVIAFPAVAAAAAGGQLIYQSLQRWSGEGSMMPFPAVFLLSTMVIAFSLGKEMFGGLWLFVPAFFHGSQYLVVTTAYNIKAHIHSVKSEPRARCNADPTCEPPNFHNIARSLTTGQNLTYWGSLLMIGTLIFGGVPVLLYRFGIDPSVSVPTVFVVVNLHHFLADHSLWRMRNAKVRELLVS